jgi:hypothetical protein
MRIGLTCTQHFPSTNLLIILYVLIGYCFWEQVSDWARAWNWNKIDSSADWPGYILSMIWQFSLYSFLLQDKEAAFVNTSSSGKHIFWLTIHVIVIHLFCYLAFLIIISQGHTKLHSRTFECAISVHCVLHFSTELLPSVLNCWHWLVQWFKIRGSNCRGTGPIKSVRLCTAYKMFNLWM